MLPKVIPVVHQASFGVRPLWPGTKVGTGELWPGGPVVNGALLKADTGESVAFVGDANESQASRGEARPRGRSGGMSFCCYVPGGGFQQLRPGVGKRIPSDGYVSWGITTRRSVDR